MKDGILLLGKSSSLIISKSGIIYQLTPGVFLPFLCWPPTILYKTVGTFCNKTSVPRSPKSMLSSRVYWKWIRGMRIPTLLGGGGRMIRTKMLNYACYLYTCILIKNLLMVSRVSVPMSFAQDCSSVEWVLKMSRDHNGGREVVRGKTNCDVMLNDILKMQVEHKYLKSLILWIPLNKS